MVIMARRMAARRQAEGRRLEPALQSPIMQWHSVPTASVDKYLVSRHNRAKLFKYPIGRFFTCPIVVSLSALLFIFVYCIDGSSIILSAPDPLSTSESGCVVQSVVVQAKKGSGSVFLERFFNQNPDPKSNPLKAFLNAV